MKKEQAVNNFLEHDRDFIVEMLAKGDEIAINTEWSFYIDQLNKGGHLSDEQVNSWLTPDFSKLVCEKSDKNILVIQELGEDDWGRKIYKGIHLKHASGYYMTREGRTYALVSGMIHLCTLEGEPDYPIKETDNLEIQIMRGDENVR